MTGETKVPTTARVDLAARERGRARRVHAWLWPRLHAGLPMLGDVAAVFLLSRIIFYVSATIAFAAIPEYAGSDYAPWHAPAPALIDASWRWDAGWYLSIVEHGYQWTGSGEGNVAFFPLYPLLIRAALAVLPASTVYVVGVLLNHVVFFVALMAVWLYANHLGGRGVAQRTVYLLSIFPAAFFFSAAYTESLFLLTSAAALLALQRGRFGAAGVAGFFAALTRVPGLYLGLPYLIAVWQRLAPSWSGRLRQLAPLALIPAGLGAYMLHLWQRVGDPLAFLKVQDGWDHTRLFPLVSLYRATQIIIDSPRDLAWAMGVVNTGAAILALALAVVALRRDWPGGSYALVSVLATLTFPIAGMPTISLARYVAVLFPMFIPIARWASRWPVLVLLTGLFLPAQAILAALFVRWYWVI